MLLNYPIRIGKDKQISNTRNKVSYLIIPHPNESSRLPVNAPVGKAAVLLMKSWTTFTA